MGKEEEKKKWSMKASSKDDVEVVCCAATELKLKNVSPDAFVIVYLDEDDSEMHHDVTIKAIEAEMKELLNGKGADYENKVPKHHIEMQEAPARRKKAEEKAKREEEERLKRGEEERQRQEGNLLQYAEGCGGSGRRRSFFEELVDELNGKAADYKKKVVPRHNLMETQEEIARRKEAEEKAKREEEERLKREEEEWRREEELWRNPDEETKHRDEVYLSRHRAMAIELAAIGRYRRAKCKTNTTTSSATAKTNTTSASSAPARKPLIKKMFPTNLRSPVCCVMGDTGNKAKLLLDCIREGDHDEAARSGRITQQQIGATHLPLENILERSKGLRTSDELKLPGLLVIDTPWHEFSFSTKLRSSSRALGLVDIAVLVVDILHGLDPQTIESLNLLKMRKTEFIVALNNVDKLYGWNSDSNASFIKSMREQSEDVKNEFNMRLTQIISQFKELGLNTELYCSNKQRGKTYNIVPTIAITGMGIPELLLLLLIRAQSAMVEKLAYTSEVQCTVLEVNVVEGHGTTIDVILVNGVLHEGDEIVVCGMQGLIVTTIRALLTPHLMKELRVMGTYMHHKEIKGAQGIKITAEGLEHAIAGTGLYVVGPYDDLEEIKELAIKDMKSVVSRIDKSCGVGVQASALKKAQIPQGKYCVLKGLEDNVKVREKVSASKIMDPCPLSSKSDPDLANLDKRADQVCPSENKDPSSPHDKDLVCKDFNPEMGPEVLVGVIFERKRQYNVFDFWMMVPNPEELSYNENLAVYERNRKLLREYKKQVRAYEGFHVDVKVFCRGASIIKPVEKDDELMTGKVEASVAFAIEKYNQSEGKDLKLKRVVKANVQIVLGFNFYLTLETNDDCFYEAKVFDEVGGVGKILLFFRSARYYPLVSEGKTGKNIISPIYEV